MKPDCTCWTYAENLDSKDSKSDTIVTIESLLSHYSKQMCVGQTVF
jgi:hypothetical protein